MASIYKRTQDQEKRRSCWFIGYVDFNGKRRTRKGYTDRSATERLAAQLEEEARMIREGLKPKPVQTEGELSRHLDDFRKHLENRDVSVEQVKQLPRRIERLAQAAGFATLADINSTDLEDVLGLWRNEGLSKQTSNHYVKAVQQFCRWLARSRRLALNPVADIPMLNVKTDRRHDRRPLSSEELSRLVEVAESSPKSIESIDGPRRAMMYVIAAWTGYRKGEIASLTLRSFDLKGNPPTVTVTAQYSKRKRLDIQVLHETVVQRFGNWVATTKPGPTDLLFPVSKSSGATERKTAKMMRLDLTEARNRWIGEAKTEAEGAEREQSDLLKYCDTQGRYADFHANRHTFITNLAQAGVSPKTSQTLARHSDIRLTLGVYTHTNQSEQVAAIAKLPSLPEARSSDEDEESGGPSNGWEHSGSGGESQTGNSCQEVATKGLSDMSVEDRSASPQVASASGVDGCCQRLATADRSTPGGIRTPNPRFRRPIGYVHKHRKTSGFDLETIP
jgi:integrase